MPIHHNSDGTWQWGKSGKKYRSRASAIKQMRAIFANGYKLKHDKKASFDGASRASQFLAAIASVGSYGMVKRAALQPVTHTIKKGDRVAGNIWSTYGKAHGYRNSVLFMRAVQQANRDVDFNKLRIGQVLTIPRFTGIRLPLYYPINWTALQNRAAANKARTKFFTDKVFNIADYTSGNLMRRLLPKKLEGTSALLLYLTPDKDVAGYLKNPQIARRNALRLKLSSGDRYATNGKASGQWQLLPGAVNHLRAKHFLPMSYKLLDNYKNNYFANNAGYWYLNLVRKNTPSESIAYSRYLTGPNHYKNLRKLPGFSQKYPSEIAYALNYKGLYLPLLRQLDYGAMVRGYRRRLGLLLLKANQAYPAPR